MVANVTIGCLFALPQDQMNTSDDNTSFGWIEWPGVINIANDIWVYGFGDTKEEANALTTLRGFSCLY